MNRDKILSRNLWPVALGLIPLLSLAATDIRAAAARGYVTASASYRLSGDAQFPAQIEDLLAISGANPRFSAGIETVEAQALSLGLPFRRHHYEAAPHSFWLFQPWFDQVVAQMDEFLSANLTTTEEQ